MSKETGGPAFPVDVDGRNYHPGQTLRDHFAGLAMQGDMAYATLGRDISSGRLKDHAEHYYRIADAMLRARGD